MSNSFLYIIPTKVDVFQLDQVNSFNPEYLLFLIINCLYCSAGIRVWKQELPNVLLITYEFI
jgi:hypothetical protein